MALSTNSIGVFDFIALDGERVPPMQTVSIDDRPGVNGAEFTLTGTKGRPFTLISRVDAQSYVAAWVFYHNYRELINYGGVELIQGGISSVAENWVVKVLDVTAIRIKPITGATGYNLFPPSFGWIECRWDLIGVPLEPPPVLPTA